MFQMKSLTSIIVLIRRHYFTTILTIRFLFCFETYKEQLLQTHFQCAVQFYRGVAKQGKKTKMRRKEK